MIVNEISLVIQNIKIEFQLYDSDFISFTALLIGAPKNDKLSTLITLGLSLNLEKKMNMKFANVKSKKEKKQENFFGKIKNCKFINF